MLNRLLLATAFFPFAIFACPSAKWIDKRLQELKIDAKVLNVKELKNGLCQIEVETKKGKGKFYLSKDGEYFIPAIGTYVEFPAPFGQNWKAIYIEYKGKTSLLGILGPDGEFIPAFYRFAPEKKGKEKGK